jgi:hypothetical protein
VIYWAVAGLGVAYARMLALASPALHVPVDSSTQSIAARLAFLRLSPIFKSR